MYNEREGELFYSEREGEVFYSEREGEVFCSERETYQQTLVRGRESSYSLVRRRSHCLYLPERNW